MREREWNEGEIKQVYWFFLSSGGEYGGGLSCGERQQYCIMIHSEHVHTQNQQTAREHIYCV